MNASTNVACSCEISAIDSEGAIELTIEDLDKLTEEFVRATITSGDVELEIL